MSTYTIRPGIASVVQLKINDLPETTCVYLGIDRGVRVGTRDVPLERCEFPPSVVQAIYTHFKHVFSLEHEGWKGPGPSPRAQYMDAIQPWSIYED